MQAPQRRTSKTKKRMRRTHYKIEANGVVKCTNCGEMIQPHRVCPECGFYKGKAVIKKEEVSSKEEIKKEEK